METEAEYKVSSQQTKLKNVLEKINEIAEASADGDYIYRGEPECYEKVSSSLYREFPVMDRTELGIAYTQQSILEEARDYIGQTDNIDKTDDIELLTEIQHFGGKTNLIDFTRDYLIALFFACDGSHEKDGRVILLKEESDDYAIRKPERTINRVESQKSVFVESRTGFVEPDSVVTIPKDLKFPMLNYLKKHHRISIATIYNDLHGFIQRSANTEFLKGLTYQRKASETENRKKKLDLHKNAITHHTEAIKLKSNYYAAYYNRGVAYYNICKFDAAIDDFNKLINFPHKDASVYNVRGLAYAGKKDFDAAIEDHGKAIDLAPEEAGFYNTRGVAYAGKSDFDVAIADFNTAIDLDPEDAGAYSNRGNAYSDKGELDKAIRDYDRAIELNPEDAGAYSNRGNAYYRKGELDKAIQDHSKSIDLDPEDAGAYSNRGNAYDDIGDFDAAIADFNTAIGLAPEEARVYYNRGVAYGNIGDFDAAIVDFNTAINLNPEEARVYNGRGVAYGKTGDFDSAITDFNTAIDLAPEEAGAYSNRGLAYRSKGDFGAAIADFNKAIALDPEDAKVYCYRGEAWLHLKEWQKAKADLTTAKDMGCDIIASFHNDYESVEAFEAKNGVKMPEDIAALLLRK